MRVDFHSHTVERCPSPFTPIVSFPHRGSHCLYTGAGGATPELRIGTSGEGTAAPMALPNTVATASSMAICIHCSADGGVRNSVLFCSVLFLTLTVASIFAVGLLLVAQLLVCVWRCRERHGKERRMMLMLKVT